MQTVKDILICPLEWGLGHAGRMVPLAKKLTGLGHNVIIGSGEEHLEFFRKEIPEIKCIRFPGFRIRYSSWLPQYIVVLLNSPAFLFQIIREHRKLRKLVAIHGIDIVISDSRPGLYNRSVKTVFVTHMLRVPLPRWADFIQKTGLFKTNLITKHFSYCFVPDLPGDNNFSGKLSHDLKVPQNVRYIGILSRFGEPPEKHEAKDYKYFCTVILSGPEPQRSILKRKMAELLRSQNGKSVILEGKPAGKTEQMNDGNILYISHLPTIELKELILESRYLVSRSGYSTIMELASLGRSALIVPTPGQTEQEYLARHLSDKGWFISVSQKEISPETDLTKEGSVLPADINCESEKLLNDAVSELLEEQH